MSYSFIYTKFEDINLGDCFFDSLKADYGEFASWFKRKDKEKAYIQRVDGNIEGFLYLKIENGPITDISPNIICSKAIKIGTMKINPHGTRLGERFIKKALDFAIKNNIEYVYVTVFSKHVGLINIYTRYGFEEHGEKLTSNGSEKVLLKRLNKYSNDDSTLNYPRVRLNANAYLLSILPKYHTRMFPDSILSNESFDIVEDVSHTNSIDKIYICRMSGIDVLRKNDLILIYRTSDQPGRADFRSVATSVCTVRDIKSTRSFGMLNDYLDYCKNYSIFTKQELTNLFENRYEYFVIKLTYNIALPKKIIRKNLIEDVGMSRDKYWGFFKLTNSELEKVIEMGEVSKGYIIN
jgi:hypothetical protein